MTVRTVWILMMICAAAGLVSCGPDLLEKARTSRRSKDQPTLEQSVSQFAGRQGHVAWEVDRSMESRVIATVVREEMITFNLYFDYSAATDDFALAYAEVNGRHLHGIEACMKLAFLSLGNAMESIADQP